MSSCYHCGEPIPTGFSQSVVIDNKPQAMCCLGCTAVAQTIVDNNLTEYYKFRTEVAQKGTALVPDQLRQQQVLDDEVLQSEFTLEHDNSKETILSIDGISCAACAWLIEQQLNHHKGIAKINVNATTQRATIAWHPEQIKLSEIIQSISSLGYHASPFKADQAEQQHAKQNKTYIKRLGVAGILMMQVMMIAIGLYFGAFSGISEHNLAYLRGVSMLLTLPIVTYGALPFYQGAINALKVKQLVMDVPVSIAIVLAYLASCFATITEQGEVYFESVSMFTFLLLIGKYLEFRARSTAARMSANLLKMMPLTALKKQGDSTEYIAAKNLMIDDVVIVKPGETIPADGVISQGKSQVNESMLSGESKPINKSVGTKVYAGTINGDGNIELTVSNNMQQSFLSQLIRLSEQAQSHKPKLAQVSDKIAQYFVAGLLIIAVLTAIYWYQHDANHAFWITIAVLVATCPCALSLATPTALTCATTRLSQDGILIKSAHAMETLPSVNCIAFDKTGTLTQGKFAIDKVITTDIARELHLTDERLLAIAARLESVSEHPIAKAFLLYKNDAIQAANIQVQTGLGVLGTVDGLNYQLGSIAWLAPQAQQHQQANCVLALDHQPLAYFYLSDAVRADAKTTLEQLHLRSIKTVMLSGDNQQNCQYVAEQLNIDEVFGQQTAEQKLAHVEQLQQSYKVAVVGDGINDTPVFGAAHVAIAMGNATDIAKNGADIVLLNSHLKSLLTAQHIAHKTKRIIYQNYAWALGYNAVILPLAVAGLITPYIAVIGMSASSILVVTNSLRLLKS